MVGDRARAGGGLVTIAVESLAAQLARLAECGIAARIETAEGAPDKAVVTDPDGNVVAFFEDPGAGR